MMLKTFASLLLPLRSRIGLIAKATPLNVDEELARLVGLARRGEFRAPNFEYAVAPDSGLAEQFREVAAALSATDARTTELRRRATELLGEAELGLAVGTARFGDLADMRFACEPERRREALALATKWLSLSAREEATTFRTDGLARESLLSQMSMAVRKHSPYHRVVTRAGMTSLAATGDECVYIARDRSLSEESARRVVVHEVFGHVVPRVRAVESDDILGKLGTFQGEDTQEGYALLCEERYDLLQGHRKRELAERHLACTWMSEGMTFADIARSLVVDHGTEPERAIRVAIRAFRGSPGDTKGLGRERVYLPYYLSVRAHLQAHPEDEALLTRGQRSLGTLTMLLE